MEGAGEGRAEASGSAEIRRRAGRPAADADPENDRAWTREPETSDRPTIGRLRFSPELEAEFAQYYLTRSLPSARFAIVLAIALYALFGILDAFIVPDVATRIWVIRYAIVCPVLLVVFGLTFTPWFMRFMQPALAATATVAGLGIVAMIAIADVPDGLRYYAGLLLVVPWAYTVLKLRFAWALRASVAPIVAYEVVAIGLKATPLELLINDNFFFLSSVIIGMVAGYALERGLRTEFLQRRMIERQRAELAAHNVQLNSALQASLEEVRQKAEELRGSRARIVVAADVERRRIERDLHDGAQQQLVALAVRLKLAESLVGSDEEERKLLAQLRVEAQEALDNLRDLARGIYPPLLSDQGLVPAIRAQAARAPVEVVLHAERVARYPTNVEAAVYFSVLEALQNVAKYARATRAVITLRDVGDALYLDVSDDGVGFDPVGAARGIGLQSMKDRIEALGGSLEVRSAPGRGTRVSGRIQVKEGGTRPGTHPGVEEDRGRAHAVGGACGTDGMRWTH